MKIDDVYEEKNLVFEWKIKTTYAILAILILPASNITDTRLLDLKNDFEADLKLVIALGDSTRAWSMFTIDGCFFNTFFSGIDASEGWKLSFTLPGRVDPRRMLAVKVVLLV